MGQAEGLLDDRQWNIQKGFSCYLVDKYHVFYFGCSCLFLFLLLKHNLQVLLHKPLMIIKAPLGWLARWMRMKWQTRGMLPPERRAGGGKYVQSTVKPSSGRAWKVSAWGLLLPHAIFGEKLLVQWAEILCSLGKPEAWNVVAWPQLYQVNNDVTVWHGKFFCLCFQRYYMAQKSENAACPERGFSASLKGNCIDSKPRTELLFIY